MSHWKIIPGINLYFITTTIVEWRYVFVSVPLFETIIESLKYCCTHKDLHLHGYVIMPNHVHYIVSNEVAERLSGIMRDFNRYTSYIAAYYCITGRNKAAGRAGSFPCSGGGRGSWK